MTEVFGPFSVAPARIEQLGLQFGAFVNRLLEAETAALGLAGTSLTTTYKENVQDGGVDAGLTVQVGSTWLPKGESAWQFKAGNLSPAKCRTELAGAQRALEALRRGASYRLVLGVMLNDRQIALRLNALRSAAAQAGIAPADDAIELIDANRMARWIEQYPALAAAPELTGMGNVAIDFQRWSGSNRHATAWVSSESREVLRQEVRRVIDDPTSLDIRIEGVSGLGKTRSVMEALRGSAYESLVVYVSSADSLSPATIQNLLAQGRVAIVVVDECGARKHESLAGLLPVGSPIRLVTIGEPDPYFTQASMYRLAPLPDADMDNVLKLNQAALWPEARRVVVEKAAGNVRLALLLAKGIIARGEGPASIELVNAATIETFITQTLPDGSSFLACSALALFTRIGYEGDKIAELETLAQSLGFSISELRSAASTLHRQGLLNEQGRYRSVGPHPLAVYLAAAAWREYSGRIVGELLPNLSVEMAERLFQRAADIGDFEPTRSAIRTILQSDGPFRSLEEIAQNHNGRLLISISVVAPEEALRLIGGLVRLAARDELHSNVRVRRDLVWALEKLAWHSRTFEDSADCLLRLALAENETWSNNSTGTWIELFGTMLPATAATPIVRMTYLRRVAASSETEVRKFAVRGLARALASHEVVTVSAEVQGGVVVEPRGTPKTFGDVWAYQSDAIRALGELANDADESVASLALKMLAESIGVVMEIPALRTALTDALAGLPAAALRSVRTQIGQLSALYGRVDVPEERKRALDDLRRALPEPSAAEELEALAYGRRWDHGEGGEFESKILELTNRVGNPAEIILRTLTADQEVPAAFELGWVLGALRTVESVPEDLINEIRKGHVLALVGFLGRRVALGDGAAFDDFLEGAGVGLAASAQLAITGRGPLTDRAWTRVKDLQHGVPVHVIAPQLLAWRAEIGSSRVAELLKSWLPRLESQVDYNAILSFCGFYLYGRSPDPDLEELVSRVVWLRADFPAVGQQEWDWVQLVQRQIPLDALGVATRMVELVRDGVINAFEGSEERAALRAAVTASAPEGWALVMDQIASGSWRLQMAATNWLAADAPLSRLQDWVGTDSSRARRLASIAPLGGEEPSDVAAYLLDTFGLDPDVAGALYGGLMTGTWMGKESDRLTGLIDRLAGWVDSPNNSEHVKRWARDVIGSLEVRRSEVLLREAESDF